MKKGLIAGSVVAILVLAGGAFYLSGSRVTENEDVDSGGWRTYSNAELGIAFRYPEKYFLTEQTLNEAQRIHHQIMIVEDTPENRALVEGRTTTPREGPIAITIDFYQNDLDKQDVLQWANNSNASSLKLGDGTYATTTLADTFAIRYKWSGLYEGETVAFSDQQFVRVLAVTYLAPEDAIRSDFEEILRTVERIP